LSSRRTQNENAEDLTVGEFVDGAVVVHCGLRADGSDFRSLQRRNDVHHDGQGRLQSSWWCKQVWHCDWINRRVRIWRCSNQRCARYTFRGPCGSLRAGFVRERLGLRALQRRYNFNQHRQGRMQPPWWSEQVRCGVSGRLVSIRRQRVATGFTACFGFDDCAITVGASSNCVAATCRTRDASPGAQWNRSLGWCTWTGVGQHRIEGLSLLG
jgi:hypothetical protein